MGGIEPPKTWDDLGAPRFHGLVALADPTKSSSAASAYEMIVQSGDDWPAGWAKLLSILGNARKFYDGASDAANAVINEAPVATCIDFYGAKRERKYPNLTYVSPRGQTAFTPDPIAILKNPPHPQLAQAFVQFVLSRQGQALWALPVGAEDGPIRTPLYRTPIRTDVFDTYQGKLLPGISLPFVEANEMAYDEEMHEKRSDVLKVLVRAAAVDNAERLARAKKALIDGGFRADQMRVFNALPENLRTRQQVLAVAQKLTDATKREKLITGWRDFFRTKYERIAD